MSVELNIFKSELTQAKGVNFVVHGKKRRVRCPTCSGIQKKLMKL